MTLQSRMADRGLVALNLARTADGWQASARTKDSNGWTIGHGATLDGAIDHLMTRVNARWADCDEDIL